MKLFKILAALAFGLGLASTAYASPGRSTNDVNMRTGPSTKYHVVRVVPAGAGVHINGCLQGRTWCDVSYAGHRGWVSSRYLQHTAYRNGPRQVYNSGSDVLLPYVAFQIFRGLNDNRRHYRRYDRPRHYIGRGHGRDWRHYGGYRGDWRNHNRGRGEGGHGEGRGHRGYRLQEQTP
jgi:uncharacterized protein YraI